MPKNHHRIRVLNLPDDIEERELDRMFCKSGPIEKIEIGITKKAKRTFALIDFQSKSDAKDAVYLNDGVHLGRERLEVEIFKPQKPAKPKKVPRIAAIHRPDVSKSGFPQSHRILVRELPKCATWQDLEDHFGAVGEVAQVKMFENAEWTTQSAHVGFERAEDVQRAIRKFHMKEFISCTGLTTVLRIRAVKKLKSTTPARRKRQSSSRSRSPQRSPKRRRASSRSRSPHRSPLRLPSPAWRSPEPDVYNTPYQMSDSFEEIPASGSSEYLHDSGSFFEDSHQIHVEIPESEESTSCRASKIQEASPRGRSHSSESSEDVNENPGILVRGLSTCVSWQDLKDHFRAAGQVEYVEIFEDTQSALVEFERDEDVQRAIRMFHMTKFTSFRGVTSELLIREYGSSNPSTLIRHRRRSFSRSHSPQRSPIRRRAIFRSRSPHRSPIRHSSSPRHSPETDIYIPLFQKWDNTEFRMIVEGIPASGTQEDLQNHFSTFGPIIESLESGTAIVRFEKYKNMKEAIRKLDGVKFVTSEGETARLHLLEDKPIQANRRRCRSRSYSHSRSPSPSYSRRTSLDSEPSESQD